jgi:hypothetical protein
VTIIFLYKNILISIFGHANVHLFLYLGTLAFSIVHVCINDRGRSNYNKSEGHLVYGQFNSQEHYIKNIRYNQQIDYRDPNR